MLRKHLSARFLTRAVTASLLAIVALANFVPAANAADKSEATFPFRDGDRVSWIGSSSTKIGVWPQTMEFLLHTRHPELKLTFKKGTTGGGTFDTGLKNLDKWLDEAKPTLVFFNYGSNDANSGEKGLPGLRSNIEKCVAKATDARARVILLTPQAADVRKTGVAEKAALRKLYAEKMIELGREKGWTVVNVHEPLEALQLGAQKDDEAFTILADTIHLNTPGYVAWGYFMYQRLAPPAAESSATLTAAGQVSATTRCKVSDVKANKDGISFVRADEILPILPPAPLPPSKYVPLEACSLYMLKVTDLPEGKYEIRCEDKPIGTVDAKALAAGVNLNSVLLASKNPAPWEAVAKEIWGKHDAALPAPALDKIGKTQWRFQVQKQ